MDNTKDLLILALEAGADAIDKSKNLKTLFYSPSFVQHPDQMISYLLAAVVLRDEAAKLRNQTTTD